MDNSRLNLLKTKNALRLMEATIRAHPERGQKLVAMGILTKEDVAAILGKSSMVRRRPRQDGV